MRPTLLTLVSLVFAGFAARLLPHAWNFTPVIAMALLAGVYARPRWLALALPLAALWLSDLVLNNLVWAEYYEGVQLIGNLGVYAAIAAVAVLPAATNAHPGTRWRGLGALGLGGALAFFFVSNGAVWASSGMYPPTPGGLAACLVAGLPFLANSVASTLAFGAAGVAAMRWARQRNSAAAVAGA